MQGVREDILHISMMRRVSFAIIFQKTFPQTFEIASCEIQIPVYIMEYILK